MLPKLLPCVLGEFTDSHDLPKPPNFYKHPGDSVIKKSGSHSCREGVRRLSGEERRAVGAGSQAGIINIVHNFRVTKYPSLPGTEKIPGTWDFQF